MPYDATPGKFFAYLNLFCFAMLILVLGSSLPVMFLGWEGVGLCSYLLIGYWYTDEDKAKAGKKAFIVNRVGDFGFLLGMFLIYMTGSARSTSRWRSRELVIAHGHEASGRLGAAAWLGTSASITPRSACCFLSAAAANRPRSRSMSGCPTRWPDRRRFRP